MVPLVIVALRIAAASTVSIDCNAALPDCRPPVIPLATTDCTDAVTVFVRSTSLTVRVPVAVSVALVSVKGLAALSPDPILMIGLSLVP